MYLNINIHCCRAGAALAAASLMLLPLCCRYPLISTAAGSFSTAENDSKINENLVSTKT